MGTLSQWAPARQVTKHQPVKSLQIGQVSGIPHAGRRACACARGAANDPLSPCPRTLAANFAFLPLTSTRDQRPALLHYFTGIEKKKVLDFNHPHLTPTLTGRPYTTSLRALRQLPLFLQLDYLSYQVLPCRPKIPWYVANLIHPSPLSRGSLHPFGESDSSRVPVSVPVLDFEIPSTLFWPLRRAAVYRVLLRQLVTTWALRLKLNPLRRGGALADVAFGQ